MFAASSLKRASLSARSRARRRSPVTSRPTTWIAGRPSNVVRIARISTSRGSPEIGLVVTTTGESNRRARTPAVDARRRHDVWGEQIFDVAAEQSARRCAEQSLGRRVHVDQPPFHMHKDGVDGPFDKLAIAGRALVALAGQPTRLGDVATQPVDGGTAPKLWRSR